MAEVDPNLVEQIRAILAGGGPAAGSDGGSGDSTGSSGGDAPATPETDAGAAAALQSAAPSELDAARFMAKWLPRTEGLERPFRLISSPREDDFSGAIIVDDDYYLDEFLSDLTKLLVSLGKLESESAVQRAPISLLARGVVGSLQAPGKNEHNVIATNQLIVLDKLNQWPPLPEQMPERDQRLFITALSHIVDNRYVLLVGTRAEVTNIVRGNPVLEPTFGENSITLSGMDTEAVLKTYLANLDEDLRAEVTSEFEARFLDYVEFNSDLLMFRGYELADYLSKEANATGSLVLPKERYTSSSLDDLLDQIVGLEKVKAAIKGLESFAIFRKRAQGHGVKLPATNMHMVFQGNPGTGKTMVADMIATMLYKIGIIRTSRCHKVSAKDLIGKYVGHTAPQIHDAVMAALGGVLFIDEAYSLMPEGEDSVGFGAEAVAQLVNDMDQYKDDVIVVLAGYEHEMQSLIEANPGMASRIGYTFHFDDYTVDELLQIFRLNATRAGMTIGEGVEDRLRPLFDYFSRFKSFGNGRFVMEVLQKAIVSHADRLSGDTVNTSDEYLTIQEADVPTRQEMFDALDWEAASAEEMLGPLVGMKTVKEEVLALERTVAFREVAYKQGLAMPDINLNMVFRGNPGTGKTTVARIIGKVLYNIGAVPKAHFEELEAKDLISSRMGGTSKETSKALERAMGGVLFVDEAYALMEGSNGREALAVLVKAMEDHKGELVVMFAGYRDEMRAFIDENPGLASRIGYTFDFEDYEADDLLEIFRRKMTSTGLELGEGVEDGARDAFKYFHSVENFGNGRFVDRYIQELISVHASHYDPQRPALITKDDLPTIKRLCEISATDVLDCTDDEEAAALRRVAIHESGHAVCRLDATGKTDIVLITIEHEGNGALGYVQHEGSGVSLPTGADLRDEMVCLLGGMAAEYVYLGSYSAGNSSDLEKATSIAMRYVATYGMSEAGLVQYAGGRRAPKDLATLPDEVRFEMRKVLDECFVAAKARIERCRPAIDAFVAELSERSTMTGEELLQVWESVRDQIPEA